VLSHYNSHNLSPTSKITAHNIFKSLAVLSEYFVFLYIGMGLFTGKYTQINIFFTFLCTGFCLLARVFNIFPLAWVANLGRKVPIPYKMQVVMWFAGLRGAIAFALVSVCWGLFAGVCVLGCVGCFLLRSLSLYAAEYAHKHTYTLSFTHANIYLTPSIYTQTCI
jgi:NhaP-type Na+/H+ or K+/H+ antiporter